MGSQRRSDDAARRSPDLGRETWEGAIPPRVWAVAVFAVAVRAIIGVVTHFTSEDYLITLRYAENLAAGHGFVYNAGESVLGTTTPLYTLFLALATGLGLPATLIGKTINILADGALCVVMYRWSSVVRQEPAGWLAAFWAAVNPLQITWSISGMETSLVTLCGAWVWMLYAVRRYTPAYVVAAILFLLRWDGVLLVAVLTAAIGWRERRLPTRGLALYGLLIAPWLLFAAWYFGHPLPVTAAAKAAVYGWRGRFDRLPQLHSFLDNFVGSPAHALVALAAVVGLYQIGRSRCRAFLPPVSWVVLYCGALLLSKVLLFAWYYVPLLPVYGVLVAVGISSVARRVAARWPRFVRQGALFASLAVVSVSASGLTFVRTRAAQSLEDNLRKPLGLWLKHHTRPTDRIMLEPIGYIGYYSNRPILDPVGLVTPSVLPYWSARSAYPFFDIAEAFRPEWCVLRPSEAERILRVAREAGRPWEERYELVRTVTYRPRPGFAFRIYRRRAVSPERRLPAREESENANGGRRG